MTAPLVSVAMLAYNHERFVAEAIDSVLMQRTDFPVELAIGEDGSPDGTRAICERYAQMHPERIRLLPAERNLGMFANLARTLQSCRGKYVALLEGDDYWTDPGKLQAQAELLEQDETLALVYHNVEYRFEGDIAKNTLAFPAAAQTGPFPEPPQRTVFRDVLKGRIIPTLSAVYRAAFLPELPPWLAAVPAPDWPLFLLLLKRGPALYLDRVMAVYRQHGGSVWSSEDNVEKMRRFIRMAAVVERHVPMEADDRRELHHGVGIRVFGCVEYRLREGRPGAALTVLRDYARTFPRQALAQSYCYKLAAKALGQVSRCLRPPPK